jgi:arginine/lysine/ornithine decarboxylase
MEPREVGKWTRRLTVKRRGATPECASASASVATVRTPFADAVSRLRRQEREDEQIVSFHALPWSQGRSLRDSPVMAEKYRALFGDVFLDAEMTYSGDALDSFFRPTTCLEVAQQLAADAFGADYTFFVTCGTTVANQVAFEALTASAGRVLIDRTAHQSLHVVAGQSMAEVHYAPTDDHLRAAGEPLLDVPQTLAMIGRAAEEDQPYSVVILSAASYNGVLYDLHQIMSAVSDVSPTTAFLIDEAWSAISAFHPRLRVLTALDAARRLRTVGRPVTVLVTHSAHKSMSAARQGSYLHVVGSPSVMDRVATTLYGRHTTSPSIPILASLDLARAHAEVDGHRLIDRSLYLTALLKDVLNTDSRLAGYVTATFPETEADGGRHFVGDPTKLLLDATCLGLSGEQVRRRLFQDYGVYVARTLPCGVLFNIHIGIAEEDIVRLLDALRSLARRCRRRPTTPIASWEPADGTVDRLLIAYPPGVPLAVPGERWDDALRDRLEAARQGGADVYSLTRQLARTAPETVASTSGGES